jgi:hypothetical protein
MVHRKGSEMVQKGSEVVQKNVQTTLRKWEHILFANLDKVQFDSGLDARTLSEPLFEPLLNLL